ncbi:unnamed protein product, partial [Closterium sp. NIES-64]
FLRDHLGPTGILKREMEALDEAIASTSSEGDAYSFEDTRPTQSYPEEYFVTQGQKVQQLQRSSLWSHSLERMAKTLAVAVGILWQHLREVYGWPDPIGPDDLEGTVGQAGLPMLYARVLAAVSQLAVTMPGTPAFTDKRKDLYLMLPTFIRHQLHSRLRVSRRRPLDEVLLGELRQLAAQMFCWLMPFSQATLQWVNDRSHSARVAGRQRVLLVQTLHFANKDRQTHADIAAAAIAAVDAAAAGSAGTSPTPPKPTAAGKPPARRRGRHSRSLSMSDIMPAPSSLAWLVDDSAAAGNGAAAGGGAGGGGMGGGADSLPKFLEELAQHGFVVSAFDRSEGRVLHQAAPLSTALTALTHPSSTSSSSLFHNPPGRLFSTDGPGSGGSGEEGKRGGKEGGNDKDMSPLDRLLARMPPPRRLQRSTTPPGNRIERAMSPKPDRQRERGGDVTVKRGSAANGTGGVGDGGSVTVGSGSSRFSSSSSVAMEGAEGGCDRRGSGCGSGNGIVTEDKNDLNGRNGGESTQSCEATHNKSQEGAAVNAAPKKDKFGNPLPPQDALAVG